MCMHMYPAPIQSKVSFIKVWAACESWVLSLEMCMNALVISLRWRRNSRSTNSGSAFSAAPYRRTPYLVSVAPATGTETISAHSEPAAGMVAPTSDLSGGSTVTAVQTVSSLLLSTHAADTSHETTCMKAV